MSNITYIIKKCPFCRETMFQEDIEESKYYITYVCSECGFVALFDKYKLDKDTIEGYTNE